MAEKQLYRYFKQETKEIVLKMTWTWLRIGNIKRKMESHLIATQNNAIIMIYIKAKIDNTEKNSNLSYAVTDKMVNQKKVNIVN